MGAQCGDQAMGKGGRAGSQAGCPEFQFCAGAGGVVGDLQIGVGRLSGAGLGY